MKKLLVMGVILLLVGLSIPSTGRVMDKFNPLSVEGNILYVGGSGEGNYTKIQDAVDNASDGDTVFVYSNVYNEYNIIVNKSIFLIGENRDKTIIDGNNLSEYVLIVKNANNVNISCFTIRNNLHSYWYGAGVLIENSNHTNICKNTFINHNEGAIICHTNCNNITILGNNITLNERQGIVSGRFGKAIDWTIKDNIIMKSRYDGIELCYAYRCNIVGNTIVDNGRGIYFLKSGKDNIVTRNIISGNDEEGIQIINYDSNIISNNTISNNFLGLHFIDGKENIIEYNNFIDNKIHNFYEIDDGLPLFFRNNCWSSNYYSRWIGIIPKPIFVLKWMGSLTYPFPDTPIPWIPMFDWRPALKPHDI